MNVVDEIKTEDCFDGSTVFKFCFDQIIGRNEIMQLKQLGELDYFPDFPRPFFRLRGTRGFQVKGVEGERDCQVILPKEGKEVARDLFIRWIQHAV